MWIEKRKKDPPCETCRIDPMEENADAIRIFFPIRNQLIMYGEVPIDLNHLAVDAAMKREGVESKECFNKILALGQWWIERNRKK